ncbi:hypothetical protein OHB02_30110 [Streptomyces albidoflavus]|nr:hypothetical protein OHB02_00085 [Streptomyces albidoflavus]WSB24463.1 hypothetical protein OHB02_30110 [Streptomyces albidoflavus]
MSQELGEPWGQQHGVTAEDQVGVLVARLEVIRRQVADVFGGRAEEQDDRAGGPHVRWQGVVGETALEERPSVVLVEQILELLPGGGGNGELTSEPTARRPFEEVSDQIAPLTGGPGDPVVDVLLGEVGEGQAALVHPGQELQIQLGGAGGHQAPLGALTADDRELQALKVYAEGPCEDTIVRYTPAA